MWYDTWYVRVSEVHTKSTNAVHFQRNGNPLYILEYVGRSKVPHGVIYGMYTPDLAILVVVWVYVTAQLICFKLAKITTAAQRNKFCNGRAISPQSSLGKLLYSVLAQYPKCHTNFRVYSCSNTVLTWCVKPGYCFPAGSHYPDGSRR